MKPEEVYISPDGKVLSIITIPLSERSYPLKYNQWYKIVPFGSNEIPIAPNSGDFVHITHPIDGKVIPYYPESFLSKSQWRQKQLNKLNL